MALIAVLAICVPALALSVYFYSTSQSVRDTVGVVVRRGLPPEKAFPGRDHLNLLLRGRDVDINRYKQRMNTWGRSDTIILARIDFVGKQIRMVSIPRDAAVRIPGYRGIRTINAAHALGGPELAVRTIQEVFGVPLDGYAVINYRGLARAIDKIGGVTVYVDKDLDYDDNWGDLHIHLKKGTQWLNGNQAIGFVRFRHSNKGGGDSDFTRMARQQRLLQALREQLRDPRVLLRVPAAIDTVREDLITTLTSDQLLSLAYFARSLPMDRIAMTSMPGAEGPVFVHIKVQEAAELLSRYFGPVAFTAAMLPSASQTRRAGTYLEGRRNRTGSGAARTGAYSEPEPPVEEEVVIEEELPAEEPQPGTPEENDVKPGSAPEPSGGQVPSASPQPPVQPPSPQPVPTDTPEEGDGNGTG